MILGNHRVAFHPIPRYLEDTWKPHGGLFFKINIFVNLQFHDNLIINIIDIEASLYLDMKPARIKIKSYLYLGYI